MKIGYVISLLETFDPDLELMYHSPDVTGRGEDYASIWEIKEEVVICYEEDYHCVVIH